MDEEFKKSVLKTGTTTLGIVCKEGIVLAADKRGTFGSNDGVSYIASREEEKIVKVNDRIVVTIAGVASDLQKVIKLTRAELKLKELKSKQISTIKEAANLFSTIVYQNIRQFSPIPGITHFLLAGYDFEDYHLFEIFPDGYAHEVKNFSASGSGMLQCHSLLDSEYKADINLQEGMVLAVKCVNAAIKRDPASGDGVVVYTITKDKITPEFEQDIQPNYPDAKSLKKK